MLEPPPPRVGGAGIGATAERPSEALVHEPVQALLDRPLEELERAVRASCPNPECLLTRRKFSGAVSGVVDDNRRVECRVVVKSIHGTEKKVRTARVALQETLDGEEGSPYTMELRCRGCNRTAEVVNLITHTKESLHLKIRDFVTHDKTLPLIFTPDSVQAALPHDARDICRSAHLLPREEVLDGERIEAIAESLRSGKLQEKLRLKMSQKAEGEQHLTYLRIGVGLQKLGAYTGILELWPAKHRSPKHQHGGCAGSVRVLHGNLDVKLFDHLQAEEPIKWGSSDGVLLRDPDNLGGGTTLIFRAGQTTWLNRSNWFVHEVYCNEKDDANKDGFALSFHVYMSCITEFEFISSGRLQKKNPSNDFFWNIDLDASDRRLNEEGVEDFASSVLHPTGRGNRQQVSSRHGVHLPGSGFAVLPRTFPSEISSITSKEELLAEELSGMASTQHAVSSASDGGAPMMAQYLVRDQYGGLDLVLPPVSAGRPHRGGLMPGVGRQQRRRRDHRSAGTSEGASKRSAALPGVARSAARSSALAEASGLRASCLPAPFNRARHRRTHTRAALAGPGSSLPQETTTN